MSKAELYFGVMSGTSMDGIDTVLVKFTKNKLELLDFNQQPYSDSFRKNFYHYVIQRKMTWKKVMSLVSLTQN